MYICSHQLSPHFKNASTKETLFPGQTLIISTSKTDQYNRGNIERTFRPNLTNKCDDTFSNQIQE